MTESTGMADGRQGLRHLFVRDLELACRIGVHPEEAKRTQRVRINLDLAVSERCTDATHEAGAQGRAPSDNLAEVVCYDEVIDRVREIAGTGHINLIETLAELIAQTCLTDERVRHVRVRVEKSDVYADVATVGVEIERFNVP